MVDNAEAKEMSLEQLEGDIWPPPPENATYLVRAVHDLRRLPIGTLRPEQLSRLIGQDVGTRWLLPIAVGILMDTLPEQMAGGFYDDDLLSAVLTCPSNYWSAHTELAKDMLYIIPRLSDISPSIEADISNFRSSLPINIQES